MREFEWQARKQRIDTKLISTQPAWQVISYRPEFDLASLHGHAVTEFPTASKPADYSLLVHGKLSGIIEANLRPGRKSK